MAVRLLFPIVPTVNPCPPVPSVAFARLPSVAFPVFVTRNVFTTAPPAISTDPQSTVAPIALPPTSLTVTAGAGAADTTSPVPLVVFASHVPPVTFTLQLYPGDVFAASPLTFTVVPPLTALSCSVPVHPPIVPVA